ncbi:MAG: hypothetical protein ACK53I_12555, partial [Phenylobacterium sp.]
YYYGHTSLLNQVRYYPYVQLFLVALFIIITVTALTTNFRSTPRGPRPRRPKFRCAEKPGAERYLSEQDASGPETRPRLGPGPGQAELLRSFFVLGGVLASGRKHPPPP